MKTGCMVCGKLVDVSPLTALSELTALGWVFHARYGWRCPSPACKAATYPKRLGPLGRRRHGT